MLPSECSVTQITEPRGSRTTLDLLGTGRREGSSLLSAASVPSTLLARADEVILLERPRHLESNASGGAKTLR